MNEQVKRYEHINHAHVDDCEFFEMEDGDYVRYEDYATLQSECETLREQVKLLQSDENSYQSGFDAGRATSAKFTDEWRKYCEKKSLH